MSLEAYEAAYKGLLSDVVNISNDLDDLLAANAMRRYDRGAVIAEFVARYAAYGDATVARLAIDRRLHVATLYEDMQVARIYPNRGAFSGLVTELRSWSRITRAVRELGLPSRTKPEQAAQVDKCCYVLEETGRLIESLRSKPPDQAHRQETAGTLYQVGRDAIETALTLDPSLALPEPVQNSSPDEIVEPVNQAAWPTAPDLSILLKVPHHKERTDDLYSQLIDMLWLARRTGAYLAADWLEAKIDDWLSTRR